MGRWILAGALVLVLAAAAVLLLWGTPAPPVAPPPPGPSVPASFRIEPVVIPGTFRPPSAPEAPPPAEAPAAKPPVPGSALAVTGRVVDDRRFPVPGARVSLHRAREPVLSAVAGEDGRFRFEGVPRPAEAWIQPGLVARAPDGRIAAGQASLGARSPAEVDAGVLEVGIAAPLAARVSDSGAPVAGARVIVGWGFSWPFEAVTGADGVARFEALPRQALAILAAAADPARVGRAEITLQGSPPQPVEVPLVPSRTVEVTVVEKGSEKPIPGATFRVTRQVRSPGMVMDGDAGPIPPVAPTDADGRTRIEGTVPGDYLSLGGASAPGFFPAGFRTSVTVRPGDAQARIELVGGRFLRFPVVAGEAPVPADGTVLTLSPMPGSGGPDPVGGARMEGTDLVVDTATAGFYMAMASAPDGARTRLWADDKGTPPREVSFRPARVVEVVAKKADGSPAAGAGFQLRNQGNNPLGDPRVTGGDGRVVFDGLYGELTECYLLDDPAMPWAGRPVGSVDLTKGGGTIEVVVPGTRTFVARVTVDGAARLVTPMYVSTAGGRVGAARFVEDPAKGEIRFELPVEPGAPSIPLLLSAPPYLPTTVTVSPVPETGPIPVEFAIRSGGVLLVEVKAPKDTSYRLGLQRWDAEKGAWAAAMIPGTMMPGLAPGPDGIARAEPLVEGRYRVVESNFNLGTEPVEVRAGGEPARLSIDVSRQGWAKGKVVLPEGVKAADVRVVVKGAGIEPHPEAAGWSSATVRIQPDGSFMVRVPGDRPVSVMPWHPTLVPAPGGGVELTEARDDLVLRLAAGARAILRTSPPLRLAENTMNAPRVLLFAGEPEGEPVSTHAFAAEGDALAFGGFKPGTWTLWIDTLAGHAPAVVRGVVLGEGDADLGTIPLSTGSRVRVKVLVKEGTAVPRIAVWAYREDEPKYWRGMNSSGEETAVVGGLGPGRFRITAMQNSGSPGKPGINEVHELDGTNDLELTWDLR